MCQEIRACTSQLQKHQQILSLSMLRPFLFPFHHSIIGHSLFLVLQFSKTELSTPIMLAELAWGINLIRETRSLQMKIGKLVLLLF
ncbi:hypothetical protein VIGAN_05165000 [Vigna angularis var. angularis]|uniref:Uncharacterized protein n=1 Tax=Vigna angularis var. angularis TaxID=157739 RepID=A0A0S3S5U9_PHAAN|nr:hypothetical protein VIGAN_05165000 [Vigna angularis var. angularis]